MRVFRGTFGAITLFVFITVAGGFSVATAWAQGSTAVDRPAVDGPLAESDVVTVDIVGLSFSPQLLTIKAGQTVRWVNTTRFIHTVTTDPKLARDPANASVLEGANVWHFENIPAGESFSIQLTAPGEYKYFCKPHELTGHLGTIVVE